MGCRKGVGGSQFHNSTIGSVGICRICAMTSETAWCVLERRALQVDDRGDDFVADGRIASTCPRWRYSGEVQVLFLFLCCGASGELDDRVVRRGLRLREGATLLESSLQQSGTQVSVRRATRCEKRVP